MEPIWKGKQTNKTSNMCTGDKGKQTNKQVEVAHAEVQMQGVVRSCVTCGVRYAMCQSMWKSFRDASEMHRKSVEFDTQGHTLTAILIVVDRLSKCIHAMPTVTMIDSVEVACLFLEHVWRHHGLPVAVIS